MAKTNESTLKPERLVLQHIGPIKNADVSFGDLTILVGPQATGKSIFLQCLMLVIDQDIVRDRLRMNGYAWNKDWRRFADLYFGEGMHSIWKPGASKIKADGTSYSLTQIDKWKGLPEVSPSYFSWRTFYVPAQRVMSMPDGITRAFQSVNGGDPYILKDFSQVLHNLLSNPKYNKGGVFPDKKFLDQKILARFSNDVFAGFQLRTEPYQMRRRLVLSNTRKKISMPFNVWSAGQREFVPLLLGLYRLALQEHKNTRKHFDTVIIEEPEMGLHPDAISGIMAAVFALLEKGFRVCLSTHSPYVLDFVWAIRFLQQREGTIADMLELMRLESTPYTRKMAKATLEKNYRSYFFRRSGIVKDMSSLDPGDDDPEISGWGGLTGGSSHIGDVVARVANRWELSRGMK